MGERLRFVRDLLTDPEITSVRLVVNPEKMVISETQRAYTYLCMYGYTVESMVVNRILPDSARGNYFGEKLGEQAGHMSTIEEAFSPLPMFKAELMPKEVLGRKALEKMADQMFGSADPTAVFSTESPMRIEDADGSTLLMMKMPFADDGKIELYTRKDVLIVQLGAFKRSVSLPYALADKKVLGAELENGWLRIEFEGEENADKGKGRKGRRRAKARRKAS
jgi:arsenite-transporting ATPase